RRSGSLADSAFACEKQKWCSADISRFKDIAGHFAPDDAILTFSGIPGCLTGCNSVSSTLNQAANSWAVGYSPILATSPSTIVSGNDSTPLSNNSALTVLFSTKAAGSVPKLNRLMSKPFFSNEKTAAATAVSFGSTTGPQTPVSQHIAGSYIVTLVIRHSPLTFSFPFWQKFRYGCRLHHGLFGTLSIFLHLSLVLSLDLQSPNVHV